MGWGSRLKEEQQHWTLAGPRLKIPHFPAVADCILKPQATLPASSCFCQVLGHSYEKNVVNHMDGRKETGREG